MRAVVVDRAGGPEVLRVRHVDEVAAGRAVVPIGRVHRLDDIVRAH